MVFESFLLVFFVYAIEAAIPVENISIILPVIFIVAMFYLQDRLATHLNKAGRRIIELTKDLEEGDKNLSIAEKLAIFCERKEHNAGHRVPKPIAT